MAKFKFRLATLLRLREAARDERRGQLAQAYQADELIQHERRRLAREISRMQEQVRSASLPGEVNVDRLLEGRRYELLLQSEDQRLVQQRQAVQAEIGRRQQALVDANRQVRVLETLRQKQLERHRQEEDRQEIKQMDETAGRRISKEEDR